MKRIYINPESVIVEVGMEKGILLTSVPVHNSELGGSNSWTAPKNPIWEDGE